MAAVRVVLDLVSGCSAQGLPSTEVAFAFEVPLYNPTAFNVTLEPESTSVLRDRAGRLVGEGSVLEATHLPPRSWARVPAIVDFRHLVDRLDLDDPEARRHAGVQNMYELPIVQLQNELEGSEYEMSVSLKASVLGMRLTVVQPHAMRMALGATSTGASVSRRRRA